MDEWAKVSIYPLGFAGLALVLAWRAHSKRNGAAPYVMYVFAAIAMIAGIVLAFTDRLRPVPSSSSTQASIPGAISTSNPPPQPTSEMIGIWLLTAQDPSGNEGFKIPIRFKGETFEFDFELERPMKIRGTYGFDDRGDLKMNYQTPLLALNAMFPAEFRRQSDGSFTGSTVFQWTLSK